MAHEPKQERAHATRDALLRCAGVVFAEKHYSAATLVDVLTTAGVSQGSLYFHFRNKHDLAIAVIAAQGAAMGRVREEVLLRADGPIDALRQTARAVSELIATSAIVQGGIRLLVQSRDEFPEVSADPYDLWLSFARARFEAAARVSLLRKGVSVDDAAWLFVAAFMGTKEIVSYHRRWGELAQRTVTSVDLVLRSVLSESLE